MASSIHHDEQGRLIDPEKLLVVSDGPETLSKFTEKWRDPFMAPVLDGATASKYIWPDLPFTVKLIRVDVFECSSPKSQQATTDMNLSRRLRKNSTMNYLFTFFVLNEGYTFTKLLHFETAGPPRRDRFRIDGKFNIRDLTEWQLKESLHTYVTSDRIAGTKYFYIDFCDTPDRYFLSYKPETDAGLRRMYRFAGYPVTQYYVLEKRVVHDCLVAEGGIGTTYYLSYGNNCKTTKGWKIINSFFAFDLQLYGSNLYTVYVRDDPFKRMMILMGPMPNPEEWQVCCQFYAFDIPIPGTCSLEVHNCTRSIYSTAASVPRHRITNEEKRNPWEFQFGIYAFPVYLDDCTFVDNW